MRRWIGGVVTAAMLVGCSSGSTSSSPEDLFLDSVEAVCRTSHAQILKLDATDTKSIRGLGDILRTADDRLSALTPPASLKTGFDDFVSNLNDQTSAINELVVAVTAHDTAGEHTATQAIDRLITKADDLADGINAIKCIGLTPANAMVPSATTGTSVPTSDVSPTNVATTVPASAPPSTHAPATTVPITTVPVTTTGTTLPVDLSAGTPPPAGYTWVTETLTDTAGLYAKPHLGPLVTFYAGGRVKSDADGSTASIYLIKVSKDWSTAPDALNEYLFWERVNGGTKENTPSGIPVTKKIGAAKDTDCVVFAASTSGISVCTFTGVDGESILDKFVDAQKPGG